MKPLSKILPRLPSPKFQFRRSQFWLFGIFLIFVLLILILSESFLLNKETRIRDAIKSKQRIEISLKKDNVIVTASQDGATLKSDGEQKTTQPEIDSKIESQKPVTNLETTPPSEEDVKDSTAQPLSEKTQEVAQEAAISNEQQSPNTPSSVSIKQISEKPLVVIIIKGLGLSSSSTREALELPKEITMGFSPYSPTLDEWVKKSKLSGHESILNIPMETKDFRTDNPGPYSLIAKSSVEDNLTRLKMLLGLTKDYNAIYSESSETFTSSAENIKPVLDLFKKEHKYFVYGGGYANYSLIQVADSINYPILVNDLVLDDDISTNAINEKFNEMEKIAKEKGYVVVMAHPYPITVRMLNVWLKKTTEKGLVVSPISTLLGKSIK